MGGGFGGRSGEWGDPLPRLLWSYPGCPESPLIPVCSSVSVCMHVCVHVCGWWVSVGTCVHVWTGGHLSVSVGGQTVRVPRVLTRTWVGVPERVHMCGGVCPKCNALAMDSALGKEGRKGGREGGRKEGRKEPLKVKQSHPSLINELGSEFLTN